MTPWTSGRWPTAAALRERIVAGAPSRLGVSRSSAPRVWWAGAGLAAACALGVAVGAVAVSRLLTTPQTDPIGAALASRRRLGAYSDQGLDLGDLS